MNRKNKRQYEPTELTKAARKQIAAARHNSKEGWPFPDAEIILSGYEQVCAELDRLAAELEGKRETSKSKYYLIAELQKANKTQAEEIKRLKERYELFKNEVVLKMSKVLEENKQLKRAKEAEWQ